MKVKLILSCFLFILTFFLPAKIFCQNNSGETNIVKISDVEPNFTSVLTGAVLSEPVKTSYGHVAICEGRTVSGFSSTGELLWSRTLNARPKMFCTVGSEDILCVVTGTSTVQVLSPTGLSLWKADAGSAVNEAPQFGNDGRIFVRAKDSLSCWGLNGIQKWHLNISSQDSSIPLVQLNDGSLLSFLTEKDGTSSVAEHISPFGEILMRVTFSGTVTEAASCADGVLLVFSDGSIGLCSSSKGKLISGWRTTFSKGQVKKIISDKESSSAFFVTGGDSCLVTQIDTQSGKILFSYAADIASNSLFYAENTSYGLVLADSKTAVCYAEDGSIVYRVDFYKKQSQDRFFFTDEGYFVLCKSDWSVKSYRVKQSVSKAQSAYIKPVIKPYSDFYKPYSTLAMREQNPQKAVSLLLKGNYGIEEATLLPYIQEELAAMEDEWNSSSSSRSGSELPWFKTHLSYAESIMTLASLTGTALYSKTLARLAQNAEDPELKLCLVRAAKNTAFDADGQMLLSCFKILRESSTAKNTVLVKEICDATLSICRYMGRPAYFRQGQEMLSTLLYPSYDKKIRDYATQTLKLLAQMSI